MKPYNFYGTVIGKKNPIEEKLDNALKKWVTRNNEINDARYAVEDKKFDEQNKQAMYLINHTSNGKIVLDVVHVYFINEIACESSYVGRIATINSTIDEIELIKSTFHLLLDKTFIKE